MEQQNITYHLAQGTNNEQQNIERRIKTNGKETRTKHCL